MWARNRKLAALLVATVSIGATAALSAEPAQPPQQKPPCGASVADALDQASQLLTSQDRQADHRAIACLIEAVKILDAQKTTAVRHDGMVIAVPKYNSSFHEK